MRADSLYDRIYHAAAKRRDKEVFARTGLGIVITSMQRKQPQRARKVCEEVLRNCPRAACTPYVCFLFGHTYGMDSDGRYGAAIKWYRKAYTLYPKGRIAEMARFYEIFKRTDMDDIDEGRCLIEKFKKNYPKSKYLACLDNELEYMNMLQKKTSCHFGEKVAFDFSIR